MEKSLVIVYVTKSSHIPCFTWAFQTYHTESGRHNFVYDAEKSLYTLEGLPHNKHEFTIVLDDIPPRIVYDHGSSLTLSEIQWKKHLCPFVGSRAILKEDYCATNKIGLVVSVRVSGSSLLQHIYSLLQQSQLYLLGNNWRNTNGSITAVQTLASATICGVIHSIIEGQPLLILGVAEPTMLMYTFMFNFAKDEQDLGEKLFLPWTGWVCVWAALLLFLLAVLGACSIINRFTRVPGELFGMLIVMLFMQQAIKGVVDKFRIPQREDPNVAVLSLSWRFGNGMFALVLSFGFLLTALKSCKARSWRYGTGWLWGSIADYGVLLLVLVWTAVSYIPVNEVPKAIPRHLFSPNPWSSCTYSNWTIVTEMLNVPLIYIFGAFIPATMIAVLYYFDHNVATTYHTESGRHNFVYDVEKSLYTLEGLPQNKHEFTIVLDDITSATLNRTTANGSSGTGVGSPDVRRQFQPEMVILDINYATKIPTKAITDALCGLESHNFLEVLSVLDIIGVPGVYSEAAALKAYPKCKVVPCDQFEAAFNAVELRLVDKVVLPIENTVRTMTYSFAIACAAQFVALNRLKDTGAVVSARATYIYGLKVLVEKIQDDFENISHFLILAREPIIPKADRPFKTGIVFTLEDGPGVLFKDWNVAKKFIAFCRSVIWFPCNETGKYDDDQMLKSCRIKIDSKFTQVKGRVLSDPKLKVGDREDLFPRNEWWNFNSNKLVEPTRVNDQYLTNILLKINGNFGGLNSMLTTEHGLNIPVISKAPAMMLGMDVSHGSLGQADVPYISKVISLYELLLDFCTSSGKRKPDQIIAFRWEDGHKVWRSHVCISKESKSRSPSA
ncbi:hypothetical protein GIB67_008848 [Kingdonia uniflora]|uniref:Uncharacterized protein n=1 Tax=Kingdonia uniflora TaxID=39325 RepID=A0A7J7LVI6_9MAGN|nr:hypothetical protein GIB67_008848 [Kingdonia uniflora]